MMKKTRMNNLDEMQDQKLLKLEEYGFWIVFWALFVSIIVQLIIGGTLRQVAGELSVLLIGSIYICITTLKNGIWTRRSTPTRKGNAGASVIPTVFIGVINAIKLIQNNRVNVKTILFTIALMTAVYVVCFVILELFRIAYNKRRSILDDIHDEESEE